MTALATVTRIRTGEPRELRARLFTTEPPHSMPVDHLCWALEERITQLWERDESPYAAFVLLPDPAAARRALDNVFAASDNLADYQAGEIRGPEYVWHGAYLDELYSLANVVRGLAAGVR